MNNVQKYQAWLGRRCGAAGSVLRWFRQRHLHLCQLLLRRQGGGCESAAGGRLRLRGRRGGLDSGSGPRLQLRVDCACCVCDCSSSINTAQLRRERAVVGLARGQTARQQSTPFEGGRIAVCASEQPTMIAISAFAPPSGRRCGRRRAKNSNSHGRPSRRGGRRAAIRPRRCCCWWAGLRLCARRPRRIRS